MFKATFLSLCLLILASAVHAESPEQATLHLPIDFDLHYVDGEKYARSLFSFGSTELTLGVGKHQIVLAYEQIWDLDAESHERVSSEPVMVSFSLPVNGEYHLLLPELKDVYDAIEYSKQPTMTMIDSKSKQLIALEVVMQDRGQKMLARFNGSEEQAQAEPAKPLEMLEYWWGKAAAPEREAFLKKVRVESAW